MDRLYRSRKNKIVAGICGGLGEYLDMDPVIVRVILIVLTLVTVVPLIAYLVAMAVIPLAPLDRRDIQTGDVTSAPANGGGTGTDMEAHVRILGVIYIVFGVLCVLGGVIVFAAIAGGGWISGEEDAIAITTLVGSILAGAALLMSLPSLIGGFGLLKKQNWARILVLVLGILNLLNFPIGTALGIYTIWALASKESEAVFRNGS